MTKKFVLLITAFCFSSFSPPEQGQLVVIVEGLRNSRGNVLTGLFDHAKSFPDRAVIGKTSQISGNKTRVVFQNLRPGRYALAIIHDENGNGKMDTNAIGIPLEGFCFGNNAMGLVGPPSFKKASIVIDETGSVTQELRIRYF